MVRKYNMPKMHMGRPTLPSSKKVKGAAPRDSSCPLTTTLLAAPTRVRLQPKLAAKASGIIWRDTDTPAFMLIPITIGRSMATTATPLQMEDRMVATRIPFSDVPVTLTIMLLIFSAIPVWNSAEPITIIAASSTMVLPEKALNRFSFGSTPANTRATAPNMEVRANGSLSVTKKNAMIVSTMSEMIAGAICYPLLP